MISKRAQRELSRITTPEERDVYVARSMLRSWWIAVLVAMLFPGMAALSWRDAQARHLHGVHNRYGFNEGDVFPWYLFALAVLILALLYVPGLRRLRRARRALEQSRATPGLTP